jgi:hypothetical protein
MGGGVADIEAEVRGRGDSPDWSERMGLDIVHT